MNGEHKEKVKGTAEGKGGGDRRREEELDSWETVKAGR